MDQSELDELRAETLSVARLMDVIMSALDSTRTKEFDSVTIPIGMMQLSKEGKTEKAQMQFTITKAQDIILPPKVLAVGILEDGEMTFTVLPIPCCSNVNCTTCRSEPTEVNDIQQIPDAVLQALSPKGKA